MSARSKMSKPHTIIHHNQQSSPKLYNKVSHQPTETSALLSQKRAIIRHNKHNFNLMSLDEYVLNSYHYHNQASPSSTSHHRHPNLTIPECTNESTESGPKPKLSTLITPHANFISLRSGGTDSLNSGFGGGRGIKPARSYDYCDSSQQLDADLYTSCSLQHSQFLLPPPSLANIAPTCRSL